MPRPRTIRARFATWTALLVLAVTAVFGAFVYARTSAGLRGTIDDGLVLSGSQVVSELDVADGRLLIAEGLVDPPPGIDLDDQGFAVRVLDGEGAVLREFGPYGGLPVPDDPSETTVDSITHPQTGDRVRVRTIPVYSEGVRVAIVQVAQSLEDTETTLARLRLTLLLGAPILAFAASAGGYVLARQALAPIDRITRTAARISGSDLSARIGAPAIDDEVGRLAATFDGMLDRLDATFQRERRLTADASHQLRTPTTAMQAILSVTAEHERTPAEYRSALGDLQAQADRMRAVTDGLMRLARSGAEASHDRVDLSAIVDDVVESFRPAAEKRAVALDVIGRAGISVVGDADALIGAVANLVDNAIKYTNGSRVEVRLGVDDGFATLAVADSGPGIGVSEHEAVFERFYRGNPAGPVAGTGLGLAIARGVAESHGGSIGVRSAPGEGSTFSIRLPVAR